MSVGGKDLYIRSIRNVTYSLLDMQSNWYQSRFFVQSKRLKNIFFKLYIYALTNKQNLQTYSNWVNSNL